MPVLVALYDRSAGEGEDQFTLLPNIWCSRIERKDGAEPSAAQFHYILDSTTPPGTLPFPQYFPQFWPITAQQPYVVQPDDELVVFGITASGIMRPLFDGHATNPKANVSGRGQAGSFSAAGVEVRLWDSPIHHALWRDANTPNTNTPLPGQNGSPGTVVALDTRFNPNDQGKAQSNCTPDDKDFNNGQSNAYPAFIEAKLVRADGDPATFWTLAKAVRYLIYAPVFPDGKGTGNYESLATLGTALEGQPWIQVPEADVINSLLQALEPTNGDTGTIDPNDASTYTKEDIILRDVDLTGLPPIDALETLLGYYDFGMRFDLLSDDNGNPQTLLEIYRKDALDAPAPKPLQLQKLGATLDPGQSTAWELHLGRDHTNLYNAVGISSHRTLHEIGIVLAPLFTIDTADAEDIPFFDKSNIDLPGTSGDNVNKYRVYGADEAGDGHWDYPSAKWVTAARFDWSSVFPAGQNGKASYVERYRPGRGTLISRDDNNKPRKANLYISRDYAGKVPALWDGKDTDSTWQLVTHNWRLLKDQLGIEIQADNPESWDIGKFDSAAAGIDEQNAGRVVRGVTAQAAPTTDASTKFATGLFYLMLVTVVESDQPLKAHAKKRKASPSQFTITRRIDCKDHFRLEEIDQSSPNYTDESDQEGTEDDPSKETDSQPGDPDDDTNTDDPNIPRDDTRRAQAMADAFRAAHELPRLAGTVTIPALSNSYNIGDRLNVIAGVNVSLQANAATEAGEAPFYPTIVGRAWEFSGDAQKTMLQITDRRTEPQGPEAHAHARRRR